MPNFVNNRPATALNQTLAQRRHSHFKPLLQRLLPFATACLISGCQSANHQGTTTSQATQPAAPVVANHSNDPTQQLQSLSADVWRLFLSHDVIEAGFSENNEFNAKLKDVSVDGFSRYIDQMSRYRQQIDSIESTALTTENQINLATLLLLVNNELDKYQFKKHYTPIMAESGFHSEIAFIPSIMPFNQSQDYQDYLTRLQNIPEFFEQNIKWLEKGIATGITQPAAILKGFEKGIEIFIVADPTDSLFYGPFKKPAANSLSAAQFASLQAQAKTIISEKVVPAYRRLYRFMIDTYLPNARQTIGVSAIPNGREYYANRAKHFTTTDKTPDQIHQIGLAEVDRIHAEMMTIIKQLDFKGSFADFVKFLRTDPQFYATSADQLLKEAAYIAKRIDAKLPSLFMHLPRNTYGILPVPDHLAPKYTTGRYIGPSRDDQSGSYWVNTYALERRPLYVLEALTLHEAVPGHHLQNALARELTELPDHRRYTYISAFGEGWGLYSEFLGIEAGFYQDPYSNFGRLTYEMWRACRLVVDTGIHIKGWTRQQAIDYLKNNTALSEHNVTTEIDRYIAWPGQALSYKMGELTIKALRHETEQALGNDFDLREFHDQVLAHGSVPLNVLEQQIRHYIATKRQVR